ncbi:phage portal protein [Morganella morganii]|uniref:phage portal protein n=2 Tax=Morganella morganii TaxID=582 RepID=UPI0019683CE8|nr:phage portal protein [Morganella morganii]QSB76488.1 phage portal protein [Morganella morganii]
MFFPGLFRKSDTGMSSSELSEMIGLTYDTYTGRRVSPQLAMQLTAVFSCVRVLAESVGMLPCSLYEQLDRGNRRAVRERLNKLLSTKPNNYMTPQEFWELLIACLCLRGNFYAYKVKALGEVVELLPLEPSSVTPKLNSKWEPEYQVTFPDGKRDTLTQDDIWHVRIFTLDGLTGLSPIAYAKQAVGLGLATEEHGSRLFGNGAVTSGVLQTDQYLKDDAYERLKTDFENRHQGLANAHKPMILEMGLKWQQISMTSEDAQFLETRKFQLEEICRIFRVPLHMIQNTDRATFNNIENLGIGFINYSLVPYLTRIEQRINVGLVKPSKQGVFYAKFNTGALLRGDMKSRFDAYATGINWGIYSPNECRELEELNPRDGGDIWLTPMNMTTKPESTPEKEEKQHVDDDKTAAGHTAENKVGH